MNQYLHFCRYTSLFKPFAVVCCMKLLYLFFISMLAVSTPVWAQQASGDSLLINDSAQLTQDVMLQQQQRKVDSLVKVQLQHQLQQTNANSAEYKELADKLLVLATADSVRKANQAQKIKALKQQSIGYPIAPFEDTLFYVYTPVGSVKPSERAALITGKIRGLYENEFFKSDSLAVVVSDYEADINYKDQSIMAITDIDALWYNDTKEKIASAYLSRIAKAVDDEREAYSIFNWMKRIAYVLLTLLILALIIRFINKLFRRGIAYLTRRHKDFFTGWRIKKAEVLAPEQQYKFVVSGLNVLRVIVIILALYLSLPVIFSVFPETKAYTETLLGWIIMPVKGIFTSLLAFLPNLITIFVIFFFTRMLIRIVGYFSVQVESGTIELPGFHKEFTRPTYNIIRFLLYAFMMVIVFPYLPGHDSPAFQGISVFLGVLLSFGSSSAISNLIAGLIITYMRPFKIGDRVKIGDITGDVLEKTMLVTRVRTAKNEDVTIPNSNVLSSYTINYSANTATTGLIVHTTITLGYDTPWKQIYAALIEAALRTDMILHDPKPFVLQTSLDDFSVAYQLNAYTREANKQALIYSLLMQNIQDCCNEAGIEILSPTFTVVRRNEDTHDTRRV